MGVTPILCFDAPSIGHVYIFPSDRYGSAGLVCSIGLCRYKKSIWHDEFNRWCKDNQQSSSMSRRGNCWDNAVAESFFSNLKSEQIKKWIYQTRAEAKSEIFDYLEVLYDHLRHHKHLDQLSPYEFERQRLTALQICLEVLGNASETNRGT